MSKKSSIPQEGLSSFEWPEFKSDRERIKAYSKRYKNMNVIESFATHYGINFDNVSERANQIPKGLVVGDIIDTKILSIEKCVRM